MDRNTRMYGTLIAVAFAVVVMFVIGVLDRARDPGPFEEVTQSVDHN
jgi:uncharacterized protein YoxC